MTLTNEIRHTRWKLIIVGLLFVLSFSATAKDPRKCRVLYDTLASGILFPKTPESVSTLTKAEKELTGLNHAGVVAWTPKEITEVNRKILRYHGVEAFAAPIPAFSKSQKLGPATVHLEEIYFSQLACQNGSEGGFTVINNAKALKDGSLKVTDLPKLRAWRDVNGKIWTLDHRRLAAMKLSGVVKNLDVDFVTEEMVATQRFKFDTMTGGNSIMVRVEKPGETPFAIVVTNPTLKSQFAADLQKKSTTHLVAKLTDKTQDLSTLNKLIERFPAFEATSWTKQRGPDHFKKINEMSVELAKSFSELTTYLDKSFLDGFGDYGINYTRSKSSSSILAKLLRKDFDAFNNSQKGITTYKEALNSIGDAIGGRLVLKSDSAGRINPSDVQSVVNHIVEEIKDGTRVTEIMNYRARGPRGLPYFSDAQINQIVKADAEYIEGLKKMNAAEIPPPMIVKSGPEASFETGYTSFQMNIRYKSGIQAEFQIKGKAVHEASEIQHFFYDLKAGKVLSESHAKNKYLVNASELFRQLSVEQKSRAMKYVEANLIHAREIEVGIAARPPPTLPAGLPKELSFENLRPHLIHD